jgi:hypothetical protein
MLTMIKTALWKAMLGVGAVVGGIAMWNVILNLMDINAERGGYADGRWVPTGTRWCEQYPSRSPVPRMWLSYWVRRIDSKAPPSWLSGLRTFFAEVQRPRRSPLACYWPVCDLHVSNACSMQART